VEGIGGSSTAVTGTEGAEGTEGVVGPVGICAIAASLPNAEPASRETRSMWNARARIDLMAASHRR